MGLVVFHPSQVLEPSHRELCGQSPKIIDTHHIPVFMKGGKLILPTQGDKGNELIEWIAIFFS